jgi:transcription elongation factor GreA-like protein
MKRALKSGQDALSQPVLRKQIFELFNKLVDAVSDDQQIFVRMRKRLQTDTKGEDNG